MIETPKPTKEEVDKISRIFWFECNPGWMLEETEMELSVDSAVPWDELMETETFFMASLFGASIPCEEYEDALFLEGLNGLNSEEE